MRVTVCLVGAALMLSLCAQADIITYELSMEFSGATPPEGATPWLRATLDDGGSAGSVDLLLETTNLTDAEFVFEWLFNLDTILDPAALVFSAPIKTGAFTDPIVSTAVDAFMADGDGNFDIQVAFDNSDGAPNRFGFGDSAAYTITGIPTLVASSFDFWSEPAGSGSLKTAAQVGGIAPNDGSGWITIPEPATAVLMVGALAFVRRRR